MGQPYVGEVRMFAGNFAPAGWAFCDGQLLPISENETLFQLIGTTYGGDGQSTFALPNLQSRIPVHQGNGYILSQMGGAETVTLTVSQIPSHTHVPVGSGNSGNLGSPLGGLWAKSALNAYSSGAPTGQMHAQAIGATGGSQPHDNMMPYLGMNYIISLFGIFPSPT